MWRICIICSIGYCVASYRINAQQEKYNNISGYKLNPCQRKRKEQYHREKYNLDAWKENTLELLSKKKILPPKGFILSRCPICNSLLTYREHEFYLPPYSYSLTRFDCVSCDYKYAEKQDTSFDWLDCGMG